MKKIALVFFALLSFAFFANAQESNVKFDKTRRGPDENGVYTISLEAYVTGNVTVTSTPAPADIILVLDYSNSMTWSMSGQMSGVAAQNQRINILRNAVKDFVKIVQTSNGNIKAEDKDDYGGHRIAFVLYSGGGNNRTSVYESGKRVGTEGNYTVPSGLSLNELLNVENLTTTEPSGSGYSYIAATVKYSGDTNTSGLLSPNTTRGTWPGDAMEEAESILSSQNYSSNSDRSRIVVFFTDGEPSQHSQGDDCVQASYNIKNSETYKATVYSVGLFNDKTRADETTTFMAYTSSDYTDKTSWPSSEPTGGWVNVSGNKSIIVTSASQLQNVFSSIAESSTPNTSAASSSSVLIDIVSTSFTIPTNTDLGDVTVYQVPNKQTGPGVPVFPTLPDDGWPEEWDITESVDLTGTDKTSGEVSVTGFDYGANWCGWDASWKNEQGEMVGKAHGSKLVLEIPIMADVNAVGGPNVATNAPGSQLIIKDKDGNQIGDPYEFVSPVISLPVNIHIMKDGLKAGESAKFTIYRTTLPIKASSQWDYVTSVFVTNGESSVTETVTVNSNNEILLTEDEIEAAGTTKELKNPVTYVRGLPSAIKVQQDDATANLEYVYKIVEEPWGWTYSFQKATGYGVLSKDEATGAITAGPKTISDKDSVTSDMFVSNPIIFNNNRETGVDKRVRNAESKATNIFQPKSGSTTSGVIIYDDSKTNTGTGR